MSDKLKVCFTDVDGVLNSRQYILSMDDLWDDPQNQMDPQAVDRLNRLTKATGAVIVVSSTWRLAFFYVPQGLNKLQDCMASYGITAPVIGATPRSLASSSHSSHCRGDEIQMWLVDNPVEAFIILDDENVSYMEDHLIKTDFETGLQDHHVEQAIALLGQK